MTSLPSTWIYWTDQDDDKDTIPDEWVWERLRLHRDRLLAASDFRMVSDAPWDRTTWESYRQALRDLPSQTSDPRLALWPQQPQ